MNDTKKRMNTFTSIESVGEKKKPRYTPHPCMERLIPIFSTNFRLRNLTGSGIPDIVGNYTMYTLTPAQS